MLVIKIFLHISKEFQLEKLQDRLTRPDKLWKFDPNDLKERRHWDEYVRAYEDVFEATGTKRNPWHIVPADKRWYRDYRVLKIITEAFESLDLAYPEIDIEHFGELDLDEETRAKLLAAKRKDAKGGERRDAEGDGLQDAKGDERRDAKSDGLQDAESDERRDVPEAAAAEALATGAGGEAAGEREASGGNEKAAVDGEALHSEPADAGSETAEGVPADVGPKTAKGRAPRGGRKPAADKAPNTGRQAASKKNGGGRRDGGWWKTGKDWRSGAAWKIRGSWRDSDGRKIGSGGRDSGFGNAEDCRENAGYKEAGRRRSRGTGTSRDRGCAQRADRAEAAEQTRPEAEGSLAYLRTCRRARQVLCFSRHTLAPLQPRRPANCRSTCILAVL
ncbi:polyphosphate kinase 2 family protein [Cohnella rhizosphaerae]|uniref:hypothetical protein n=1 Tax=Cohnella rhizosphaerae TaxID=1457232 RepID=UPI003B8A89BA